jgi:hypothetical protein
MPKKSHAKNHNHNHNEIHIHISDKKKSSRKKKSKKPSRPSTYENNNTVYRPHVNRLQYFDHTTQSQREIPVQVPVQVPVQAPVHLFSDPVPVQTNSFQSSNPTTSAFRFPTEPFSSNPFTPFTPNPFRPTPTPPVKSNASFQTPSPPVKSNPSFSTPVENHSEEDKKRKKNDDQDGVDDQDDINFEDHYPQNSGTFSDSLMDIPNFHDDTVMTPTSRRVRMRVDISSLSSQQIVTRKRKQDYHKDYNARRYAINKLAKKIPTEF